jgi:hypothetical protein
MPDKVHLLRKGGRPTVNAFCSSPRGGHGRLLQRITVDNPALVTCRACLKKIAKVKEALAG